MHRLVGLSHLRTVPKNGNVNCVRVPKNRNADSHTREKESNNINAITDSPTKKFMYNWSSQNSQERGVHSLSFIISGVLLLLSSLCQYTPDKKQHRQN